MAGNSERIDEIVDRASVSKQLNDTTAEVGALEKALVDSVQGARLLNAELAKAQGFRQVQVSAEAAAKAVNKMQQEELKLAQAQERLNALQQRTIAVTNQAEAAQIRLSNAQEQQRKSQERAASTASRASGEYAKLLAAYNAATLAARNAGATFGTQSQQFTDAATRVQTLRGELDAIDQPLGNFQRNVGNYANGIVRFGQRAFGAIRLVANILPGLGLSGAFLLIFEGLQLAVEKLGIFSAKAKYELTDVQKYAKEAADNVAGDFAKLNILYEASQNANLPLSQRLAVVKELQKEYPAYFGNLSKEAILAGDAASAYENLSNALIQKAVISAGQKNLEEALKPLIELRTELNRQQAAIDLENQKRQSEVSGNTGLKVQNANDSKGFRQVDTKRSNKTRQGDFIVDKNGDLKTLTNYQKEITDKVKEVNAGIQVALQDFGINGLLDPDKEKKKKPKKIADTRKQVLEQQLKEAKLSEEQILNSEKSSFDDRLLAVANYEDKTSTLLAAATKNKVITHQEEQNHFLEIDKDTSAQRIKIAADAEKELLRLIKDGDKEQTEILKNSLETADKFTAKNKADIQANSDDALLALSEQYAKGLISTADYNRQKKDIADQTDLDLQDAEINGLKYRISIEQSLLEDDQKDKDKLAELEKKRSKTVAEQQIADAEKVAARKKALQEKEIELGYAVQDFAVSLVEAGFERRKNELQDQKNALDERTQSEIDAENRSLDSTSVKADKINIINAKAAAQKQNLDNKQKQADIAKAKFDKAVSIARIIENTAQGIAKTIAELGLPFATPFVAIAAALGAVQLATVIATPIPKYEKGTKAAKGGLSIWGEAGTELAIDPSGRMSLSPDTATYADIPKGTQIIPHVELLRMIKAPQLRQKDAEQVPWKEVIKAIKQQKEVNVSPRISGWVRENAKQNKWDSYRKNHFN